MPSTWGAEKLCTAASEGDVPLLTLLAESDVNMSEVRSPPPNLPPLDSAPKPRTRAAFPLGSVFFRLAFHNRKSYMAPARRVRTRLWDDALSGGLVEPPTARLCFGFLPRDGQFVNTLASLRIILRCPATPSISPLCTRIQFQCSV